MISQLQIKNFAIIDTLEADFKPGLTTITGETGAGKSIIIGALELVLGGRADHSIIRHGQERCEITVSCELESTQTADAEQWLKQQCYDSDNTCIIRRIINKDGKSRASINGNPVTLQQIREFANLLINFHGQHQNQALLKRSHQLELLDRFAGHRQLIIETNQIYQEWRKARDELSALRNETTDHSAQLTLLQYQVDELIQLDLKQDEYQALDQEHKQLANRNQHLEVAQILLQQLSDADDTIIGALYHCQQKLINVKPEIDAFKNSSELINNAIMQTEEAISELRHFADRSDLDPERLAEIESRLQKIHDIARKHHVTPETLYQYHAELESQLEQLLNADQYASKLEKVILAHEKNFQTAAAKLSQSRQKAAKKLSQQISAELAGLGMPKGVVEIQLIPHTDATPHLNGAETVDFQVSTNPGQPLQPLTKVASGGEISRIALAIQVITAALKTTPVLIFDEVDVGIGGSTAAVVGKLLRQLGANAQVFCITHLPQVAAHGHQHLRVEKQTHKDTTQTQLRQLSNTERAEEVARMLGGEKITDKTLANAEELLSSAEA